MTPNGYITVESLRQARKKGLVAVMLSVFGDESSDETGQRTFAVAGIMGTQEEWDALEVNWLKRTGGKIFHATDCESGYGDYKDIPKEKRHKEYEDLTKILAQSNMWGFGCAMDIQAYKKLFPEGLDIAPYFSCFVRVILFFARLAYHYIPRQPKAKFIFDRNSKTNFVSVSLVDYFTNLTEYDYSSFVGQIAFDSIDTTGIQVADLLARETMKHMDNQIGPVKRRMRLSMASLLKTDRFDFIWNDETYWEDFRTKIDYIEQQTGMNYENYKEWLLKQRCIDNGESRNRYLFYTDSLKKAVREGM